MLNMKKLITIILIWFLLMFAAKHVLSQNKWCDKDPNHPLCICEKNPTHPICCCVPVELVDFTVKANGYKAEVRWSTVSEENNSSFSLWRSNDANTWEFVTHVPGHGTTKEKHSYKYIDEDLNSNKLYYRLEQADFDGTIKQLGVKYIKFEWSVVEGFKVYGDIISYEYFDATGGIAGNEKGFKVLKVKTKQGIYIFKLMKL